MRRGWCELVGCYTHGSEVLWIDLGPLGVIPVWACRGCAASHRASVQAAATLTP